MVATATILTRSLQTESLSGDTDRLINDVLLNAGVVDVAGDSFKVAQNTGADMKILVGSGSAGDKAVNRRDGRVYIGEHQNATQEYTIAASDPTNDRIDLVVYRTYDDEADSSGNTYSDVEVIQGTPAGSPTVPATPAGSIDLASILVPAAASAITDGDITDLRAEALVRDELLDLQTRVDQLFLHIPSTKFTRSTNQSIPNNTSTTVAWEVEDDDSHPTVDLWSHAAGVVTINRAGRYRVSAGVVWASNSTGRRQINIAINGVEADGVSERKEAFELSEGAISSVFNLALNDTVELKVNQSSGGALNVTPGERTFLAFEALHVG